MASTFLSPDAKRDLQKKIMLGKAINADYLTLHDASTEEPMIQVTDGAANRADVIFKDFEKNDVVSTQDVSEMMLVKELDDPGILMGYVVYMQEKKRQHSDAFEKIAPNVRKLLNEKVEPHCTIVSCKFKIIALTQHLEGLAETHSGEMLVNLLTELYGRERSRTTMLEMATDTWKCGPYISEKAYHFETNVVNWCKKNSMRFFQRLLKLSVQKQIQI